MVNFYKYIEVAEAFYNTNAARKIVDSGNYRISKYQIMNRPRISLRCQVRSSIYLTTTINHNLPVFSMYSLNQ